MVQPTNVTAN